MTNANSLTGAIIDWIRMQHGHAERINNISRTVRNKFGQDVHIPSAGFRGTADIHACKHKSLWEQGFVGQFVAIEVKIGRDKQSDAQAYYQECVTKAGGVYMIVRDFDEFLNQWNEI